MPSSTPIERLFRALLRLPFGPVFLASCVFFLFSATSGAVNETPVFLVLTQSGDDRLAHLEQQLVTALQLEMDGLEVDSVRVTQADFSTLDKEKRFKTIERLAHGKKVAAAGWLELVDSRIVLLHVVVFDGARRVSQTLGAGRGSDTAQELAFSVQEMMGQVVLREDSAQVQPAEDSTREADSSDPPSAQGKEHRPRSALAAFGCGVGASQSALMLVGGGIGVELELLQSLFAMISFVGVGIPLPTFDDGSASGGGFALGIDLGFSWEAGPLGVGPTVGVLPGYYGLKMKVGEGERKDFSYFDTLVTAGLDLRFRLMDRLRLVLTPALGLRFHSREFARLSDSSHIATTSFFNWSVRAGLRFAF